jgi:hypothetical protein
MHGYLYQEILIYTYIHAYTCVYFRIYSNKHTPNKHTYGWEVVRESFQPVCIYICTYIRI